MQVKSAAMKVGLPLNSHGKGSVCSMERLCISAVGTTDDLPGLQLIGNQKSSGFGPLGPPCEYLLQINHDVVEKDAKHRQRNQHGKHERIIGTDLAAVE